MDLVTLAQQATNILVPCLPFIYTKTDVVDKVKDMLLEKGIETVGSKSLYKAKVLLDKITSKKSESVENALDEVSKNSEDPKSKGELKQEILKLLRENLSLAREIELTINIDVENVDQLSVGNYNNFFNFETPSGEELIKIIDYLDQRRKIAANQKIMSCFNPSALPYYPEKLKKFATENRVDELRKTLTYIENHRILLISGVGGVGKSTLARALVDLRPINVPEPFWFSFYDNQDAKLSDILEKLAAYINAPEIAYFIAEKREPGKSDIDKFIGELYRRSEIWLIFDDLSIMLEGQHFADNGTELLFYSLRSNTHNAKIIITSRVMPILENGERLIDSNEDEEKQHLNGLRTNFAVDYLASNGLNKIEYQKLEELAIGVDGHPLALKLLTDLVKVYGVSDVLSDLSIYEEQKEDTIKKARKLFDKLAGDEKDILERISVYRGTVKLKGLREMFTENTPKNSVMKLIDKSLLETDHNGNYWLHPLVQEFSYDDLKNRKEAHLIAYHYYNSLSLPENPTRKEDFQSAIDAYYHACEAEEYDLAADTLWKFNLYELLSRWGHPITLIEIYEKLLPKDHFCGEPILKDKRVHGTIIGNVGVAYGDLGDDKKAIEYYEQALMIAREIGDRRGEGNWLGNIGNAYRELVNAEKAIEYYEQALMIAREIGDKRREGIWLGNMGVAYYRLGDAKKAIEYYEQALMIAGEIGDRYNEEKWFGNIGNVYSALNNTKKAIEYREQALMIAREIGDRRGEGIWLGNMGNVYSALNNTKKAIEYREQALMIAREIGDRRSEGNWLGNIGNAYSALNDAKKAIEYYEQALMIAREIGDRSKEGNWLETLGLAYNALNDAKKAVEYYEQALMIAREIGDRSKEGDLLGTLGLAYSDLDDAKKAIEYYEQALMIAREIGDRSKEGDLLGTLGLAYSDLGDAKKAIEYYEQALVIAREIGNRRDEGNWLGTLGAAYYHFGDAKKTIEYCEQALMISREISDRCGEGADLGNLGLAYHYLGDAKKAIEYYEQTLKINPGDAKTWYNKACACSLMNNKNEALEDLKYAIELDPDFKELAKNDKDLEKLWEDKDFKDIVTAN